MYQHAFYDKNCLDNKEDINNIWDFCNSNWKNDKPVLLLIDEIQNVYNAKYTESFLGEYKKNERFYNEIKSKIHVLWCNDFET